MAASNELLILINADAKNAKAAFDDVKKKTEDLTDVTSKASLIAGAAFAALSAEVFFSVSAYGEALAATNALTQSLQNQGIYTKELAEDYDRVAKAVEAKTGVDGDQLVSAQAVAQSYLGSRIEASQLTQAIADLSTKYGSAEAAATILGKTIGTKTNALAREGLVIRDNATEQERLAKVLEFVNVRFGGQAEAANRASFGMNGLKVALGDVQEAIGERFAPIVEAVAKRLTQLAQVIKNNEGLADFAAALIAGGLAASGLVVAVGGLVGSLVLLKAGLAAAGVAATISTGGLFLIVAAVGVVAAAAFDLASNWEKRMAQMGAAVTALVVFCEESFGAIGRAINALVTGNAAGLVNAFKGAAEAGIKAAESYEASMKGFYARQEAISKESEQKQNAEKLQLARQQAAEKQRLENLEIAATRASDDVKLAQLRGANAEQIKYLQETASIRKALVDEDNATVIAAAQNRLRTLSELQRQANAEEIATFFEFQAEKAAAIEEAGANADPSQNPILFQQLEALRSQKQTEQDIENAAAAERLQRKIAADNEYLKNQQRFGKEYAAVQKVLNSDEVKAADGLAGELVALANSKNATLKAIGKAAAISQIAIATATSAAKVFADSVILFGPVAGPPIGAALAAARVAYGIEQTAAVTAAANGALVGGTGNTDNQPFMLTPGELVAPRRNFDEVVSGVQTERSGVIDEIKEKLDAGSFGGGVVVNVSVQGDFLGDESTAQKLGRLISDQIEFNNLRFAGVNI